MAKGNTAILALQAEVNKHLEETGAKSRLLLGSDERFFIQRIDSGSLTLNRILGGGFARGRHVELFGSENSAKSYVTYKSMALAQARGEICALIDPEGAFDAPWFEHLGGIPNDLLIERPKSAEEAIKTMMLLLKGKEIDAPVSILTVDSVSALVTIEEIEKDPTEGQTRIASQARMMSESLRRLGPFMDETVVLWINQLRTNIGPTSFAAPNVTSGGRALKFYATTRVQFQKDQREKRDLIVMKRGKATTVKIPYGNWVQLRVDKEKSTKPFGEGTFFFDTDRGTIDFEQEILDLGQQDGLIKRTGNSYEYTDDIDGQVFKGSKRGFLEFLEEDEALREELLEKIEQETSRLAAFEDEDE